MEKNMTAIDRLIKDMQELKKTKLYASSFKCIDDCLFLAEYYKKEELKQLEEEYVNGILQNDCKIKFKPIKTFYVTDKVGFFKDKEYEVFETTKLGKWLRTEMPSHAFFFGNKELYEKFEELNN